MVLSAQFLTSWLDLKRSKWMFAALFFGSSLSALWTQQNLLKPAVAGENSTAPAVIKEKDPNIVPVLCVRPGEKKDCVFSTECTVGSTRGGGLSVREMGDPAFTLSDMKKSWTKAGLTLTVPGFAEATKTADSPRFAALKQKGYDAFVVTAEATKDAAAGIYEIHLADSTCSGHCRTTLRVVVHRAE